MPKMHIADIEKEVGNLPIHEQIELIETLVRQLRKKGGCRSGDVGWSEICGLGKGLWDDQDAQEYVEDLRRERL